MSVALFEAKAANGLIYPSIHPSIDLSVYLSLPLSLCLSVCLAGWLAGWPAGCLSLSLSLSVSCKIQQLFVCRLFVYVSILFSSWQLSLGSARLGSRPLIQGALYSTRQLYNCT